MTSLRKAAVLFICLYIPLYSMAWGALGHRIVAGIAESYLTKKARRQIAAILGNESMAIASTWADFIKSDPEYNYLSPWHYANIKAGLSEQDFRSYLQADTTTDAYAKLQFLIAQLKDKSLPANTKQMYLRLLIHIVGDVHQPMHLGRLEDLGGNKISVMWFRDSTNLHAVWDEKIIEAQQLSYTEYIAAINHTTRQQRLSWQRQSLSDWLYESYQASGQLYHEINRPWQRLSYRYSFDHLGFVNESLLKAGVRLAGVLNEIFG